MNNEQKANFKLRSKQDKHVKLYNNFKKIHNQSENEMGVENQEMNEWVSKAATYKKPPKRLPHNKDVFV